MGGICSIECVVISIVVKPLSASNDTINVMLIYEAIQQNVKLVPVNSMLCISFKDDK